MCGSKGKEKARPKSANFTEEETNALVGIVYDLFKESGESELIIGKVNWDAVRDKLNVAFKNKRTADNVRWRFKTLKGQFSLFKELRGRSEWTWDAIHSKIVALNNEAWQALIEAKWQPLKNGKRFPWYDAFELMVGSSMASEAKSHEAKTTVKTEILEPVRLFPPPPVKHGLVESHRQVGPTNSECQSVVPESGCENIDLSLKTGPPLKKSRVTVQSDVHTGPLVSGTTEIGPPPGFSAIDPNRSKRKCNSGYSSRQKTQQPKPVQPKLAASMHYKACEGVRTIQNALTAVCMLSTKGLKEAGKMLLLNCHATLRDLGQEHRLHRILRDNNLPIDVVNIPSDDEAQVFAPATVQECARYCQGMPPPTYPSDETGPSQGPSLERHTSFSDRIDDAGAQMHPPPMVPIMQERGGFAGIWQQCIWQQHSIPCAKGTDFTESETNALVSIVYDLFNESGETELIMWKVNWDAVRDKLNEAFKKNRRADDVRLRFKTLMTTFNRFKELRGRDGWTWDTVHSTIVAPNEEAWQVLVESKKKKWQPLKNGKRFPWYDVFALMLGGGVATGKETNEGCGSSKTSLKKAQNLNLNKMSRGSGSTGLGKRKTRENAPPNGAEWKAKLESFNLPHDEYWYMYDLMKDPFYVQQLMDVTDEKRVSYLRRKMPWYNQNWSNVPPNRNTTPFAGYMPPFQHVGYQFRPPF